MQSIEKIIETIKSIENIDSDYALANLLKINQSTITTWKNRGTIPYKVLLEYCENRGMVLNTILTGEGRIYKQITKYSDKIITKIMEKEGFSTIDQIAEILKTTQYQLGLWKKSRYIPIQILENYCETHGVNINWLLESSEYAELIELRNELKIAEDEAEYRGSMLTDVTKELNDLKASLKKIINK